MGDSDSTQASRSPAEIYDEFLVPALFQKWASRLADAAWLQPGQHVLDVACGTGILARTAAGRVGTSGAVVGLDLSDDMLAVAAQKAPQIEWRQGIAEILPFEAGSFDAVVSQFGLMFFQDRRAALREMLRVLRPGSRLAVAVWGSLDQTPSYAAMADLVQRLYGEQAGAGIRSPFRLGNVGELQTLVADADIPNAEITSDSAAVRFASVRDWVYAEMGDWVLDGRLSGAQYEHLVAEAKQALAQFITAEGAVAFDMPAHIVTATRTLPAI